MVQKIVNNDMSEALKQPAAVIDFSATWCGPCKMLAPVLEEVSEEMSQSVAFYNIDSDENAKLAAEFQVMNIPCLYILKNGEVVAQSVGFMPKPQLEKWIQDNI